MDSAYFTIRCVFTPNKWEPDGPQKAVSVSVWHICLCVVIMLCLFIECMCANDRMLMCTVSLYVTANPRCGWNWSLPYERKCSESKGRRAWWELPHGWAPRSTPPRQTMYFKNVKWDMRGFLVALWAEAHNVNSWYCDFDLSLWPFLQQNHQGSWFLCTSKTDTEILSTALFHAGDPETQLDRRRIACVHTQVHNNRHIHSN